MHLCHNKMFHSKKKRKKKLYIQYWYIYNIKYLVQYYVHGQNGNNKETEMPHLCVTANNILAASYKITVCYKLHPPLTTTGGPALHTAQCDFSGVF